MFDGVDVDVIDVTHEIALVANGMLPIAPLPDAPFALAGTAVGNPFAGREATRKRRFDEPPTRGKSASPSGIVHTVCR